MCGILGDINLSGVNGSVFERQLEVIHHRGPDGTGIWNNYNETVFLGSKRLSIQDLSKNGSMPMKSDDGRYVIVFNGEIYNFKLLKEKLLKFGYTFNSNSDTEVVLKSFLHFGIGFLEHLVGMFAIAIYDSAKEELVLARDRIGEKPLYYWENSDGISFASQLNQLFLNNRLDRNLDYKSLQDYLSYGYVREDRTLIKDVKKLMPAHYLIYSSKKKTLKINEYWSIPKYQENSLDEKELVQKFDGLMKQSVKNQLISDVPVGVLLSGGVDSSLVTAYASETSGKKIQTFHISLEGHSKINEAKYAKSVSNYFGTSHVVLGGDEIEYELLDVISEFTDEPLSDSSLLPSFLVSKLTSNHLKVVLGGDGGDELFGGYKKYERTINLNKRITKNIPNSIRNMTANISKYLPTGMRGRHFLMSLSGDIRDQFISNTLFDNYSIRKILKDTNLLKNEFLFSASDDLVYDITKIDMRNYLPNDILFKVDRSSMAYSLEARAPFLDKNIVEFAFKDVKSEFKIKDKKLKLLPKLLLNEKIKDDINFDRKQGFSIPLDDWFRTKWHDSLLTDIHNFEKLINKDYALSLLSGLKKGRSNSEKLFALVMLDKWLKNNNVNY
jgi:asparagine synthase (glutamine-hydrolysing)